MKIILFIILFYSIKTEYKLLKKYSSVTVYDGKVIFESKDFKENDEMYFKIKSTKDSFTSEYAEYYYINDENDIQSSQHPITTKYTYSRTEDDDKYELQYFTIKKKSEEFGTFSGDYIYIHFDLESSNTWAEISNTEEDEGKLKTWVYIVIVVVIVIILICIGLYFFIKKRKEKKALEETKTAENNNNNQQQNQQYSQNELIAKQNYQPQNNNQNYQQQQQYNNPNYQQQQQYNNQNYQQQQYNNQTNEVQVYQNQNYMNYNYDQNGAYTRSPAFGSY